MHSRTLNPCVRIVGLLALAIPSGGLGACADDGDGAQPNYYVSAPPPGAATTECRELIGAVCNMWVRCGELAESDYDDCTLQLDAQIECPDARLVTAGYPECMSTLENECRSMERGLHNNCRGVVFF